MRAMDKPAATSNPLIFLKLGGSLITDKTKARSPRLAVMERLAAEIKAVLDESPEMRLVLGHGSGSFCHVAARKHGTRLGVHTSTDWQGFVDVWYQARCLNQMMMVALHSTGLPALSFPVSGSVIAEGGKVVIWDLTALNAALAAGLVPVVYGDVVFDQTLGGTILSTEDIFSHLADVMNPGRILLAGIEAGVWGDYPELRTIIPEITPGNWEFESVELGRSAGDDVTGGMASKVAAMVALVNRVPGLETVIFSGKEAGNLAAALRGDTLGTRINVAGW